MSDEPTEIDEYGAKIWKNAEGQIHRDDDLPAVITLNGYYTWYQNGKRHRDNDLPAMIYPDGSWVWCQNDECHRDNNLPAVIWKNRHCEWWVEGEPIQKKRCTKKRIEQYKKPFYFQKTKKIEFNRFKKLIK